VNIWQALFLGIVQGLTEFLPVSSSGHLAAAQIFLDLPNDLLLAVLLHFATLAAVIIFFWKDLWALKLKQWMWIAAATVPVGIIGIIAGDLIESGGNYLWFVAIAFLVTGIFNLISQKLLTKINADSLSWPTPLKIMIIGCAQAVALIPGISRSGTTVMAGLATGLEREAAFRFSFFLLIPATLGAVGLESIKLLEQPRQDVSIVVIVAGMIAAFVTGFASLRLLQVMIRQARFAIFGYYSLLLGMMLLVIALR
jgi:undecaprenyl-diphosphatase